MSLEEKLSGPHNAVIIAIILTILVAIESIYVIPWAPYFLIYAALAIMIPYWLHAYKFRKIRELGEKEQLTMFVIFLGISFIVLLTVDFIYSFLLSTYGLKLDPMYDLSAALENLAFVAAGKFNITTESAFLIYAIYVMIWAPIGEELFYRGYLYGELRKKYGIITSNIISSFLFGIRHATHFLFLLPDYPLIPGLYWSLHAFIFGIIIAYAYEKTDNLCIPMLIHFLFNLISAAIPF